MNKVIILIVSLTAIYSSLTWSQDFSSTKIKVTPAAGDVYMLQGAGGNIGVLATKEGLLLVDDEFYPLAQRIEEAMHSIVKKLKFPNQLKYIVNTHYHGDHTGSNGYFSDKAPIFAHENVRHRLHQDDKIDVKALPVVTYLGGLNIHLDQENIQLTHLPNGHTDGDSIVYFKKANVLQTGDLFFELGFPFIDLKSGGSVRGYLANVHYMLEHTPDDVVIIPGHGEITNKTALKAFAKMIEDSISLVTQSLAQGKSEADIISDGISDNYKHLSWSFITEERWLKTLVADLSKLNR